MKKILALFFLCVLCGQAVAEYRLPEESKIEALINEKYRILKADDKCDTLSNLAKIIVKYRQRGVDIEFQYRSAESGGFPDDIKEKERQIIKQAYEIPVFHSELDRNKIEVIFGSNAFIECRKKGMGADWNLY